LVTVGLTALAGAIPEPGRFVAETLACILQIIIDNLRSLTSARRGNNTVKGR